MARRESALAKEVGAVLWAFRKDNGYEPGKIWNAYLRNYVWPRRPQCRCGKDVAFAMLPSGSLVIVEKGTAGQRGGQLAVWLDGQRLRAWRLDEEGRELLPGMYRGTEHVKDRCPSMQRSAAARKAAATRKRHEHQAAM